MFLHSALIRQLRAPWLAAMAVAVMATGCQPFPEELAVTTWTPVVAVPLVDTRFDLSDVLEMVTDSVDTVPVATTSEGELAFYHEQNFTGSVANEWLVLPGYSASESVTLGAQEALALNLLPPGQSITFEEAVAAELEIVDPEDVVLDRIELSQGTSLLRSHPPWETTSLANAPSLGWWIRMDCRIH